MSFQTTNLQSVSGWIGRLVLLDLSVFDEIRSSPSATSGALAIVFGASIMAGIGSWLWAIQWRGIEATDVFIKSLVLGSILQTFVWLIWVYLVFQVLARAYGARTDFYELIRTMGFAFAPVGLSILVAIPNFTVPFGIFSLVSTVLLTHFAIQSSSSAEQRQVLIANLAGFAVFVVVMGVLANVIEVNQIGGGADIGGLAPGLLFFDLNF
jgi:hypothetical protein